MGDGLWSAENTQEPRHFDFGKHARAGTMWEEQRVLHLTLNCGRWKVKEEAWVGRSGALVNLEVWAFEERIGSAGDC